MEQSSSSTPQSTVLVAVTTAAPVASSPLVGTSALPMPVSSAPPPLLLSVRIFLTPADLESIATVVAGWVFEFSIVEEPSVLILQGVSGKCPTSDFRRYAFSLVKVAAGWSLFYWCQGAW